MVKIPRAVLATQAIGCVRVPDFAIALLRQAHPELTGLPVALVQYGKIKGKIIAVSMEAASLGIVPGLAMSRARSLSSTVHFITYEPSTYEAAIQALLPRLWTLTNRVEIDRTQLPATFVAYLDFGRIGEAERDLLHDELTLQIAEAGYLASTAFASGKLPAYVALLREIDHVPSGEEAQFIADAPIEVLSPSKELLQELKTMFIYTVGEFANKSRAAVAGRFGRDGVRLHELANGMDGRPVIPDQMPAVELLSYDPDEMLTTRDQINAIVKLLSEQLAERLDRRYAALHEIALTLHFVGGKQREERLHLLQPVSSVKGLYDLLWQLINRRTLTEAIIQFDIRLAHLVSAVPQQLELFTDRPTQKALIDAVTLLAKRYGHCFYQGRLAEVDSLIPEERFYEYQVTG